MEDCLSAMSIFSVRFFIRLWKRTLRFARILIRLGLQSIAMMMIERLFSAG